MIARLVALSTTTIRELMRSRIYLSIVVAGVALIGGALVLDRVSGGQTVRVLVDMGLWFTSLVSAGLAAICGVMILTSDIASKQIHLSLARPISRVEIVLGRFLGIAIILVITNLVLGLILAGLVNVLGETGGARVVGAALFLSFEGLLIAALAVFFGVSSSSTMSGLFTAVLFVLGRLTPMLADLIEAKKFAPGALEVAKVIYAILPQLGRFDLSEWARLGEGSGGALAASVYGLLYTAALVGLAGFKLERRNIF